MNRSYAKLIIAWYSMLKTTKGSKQMRHSELLTAGSDWYTEAAETWPAAAISSGLFRTNLNDFKRHVATGNILIINWSMMKHTKVDANQRRLQRSAFSTYKLEAGLPVTKMLGFSNKINNKINLTIIYRYSYIYILQSAISLMSEKPNWSAAAGGSDKDDVLKWWRQYREEERCTVAGAAQQEQSQREKIT